MKQDTNRERVEYKRLHEKFRGKFKVNDATPLDTGHDALAERLSEASALTTIINMYATDCAMTDDGITVNPTILAQGLNGINTLISEAIYEHDLVSR